MFLLHAVCIFYIDVMCPHENDTKCPYEQIFLRLKVDYLRFNIYQINNVSFQMKNLPHFEIKIRLKYLQHTSC